METDIILNLVGFLFLQCALLFASYMIGYIKRDQEHADDLLKKIKKDKENFGSY
jgi:hypothetical protein